MSSLAILNLSDLDESFKSPASLHIPMTELSTDNQLPVLSSLSSPWKKRMCVSILLLILGGFLATLVYLCVKVEWMSSLYGNYSVSVPAIGDLSGLFKIKEGVKLDLSGKLAALKPSSVLWDQTYLDLEMS